MMLTLTLMLLLDALKAVAYADADNDDAGTKIVVLLMPPLLPLLRQLMLLLM